GDKGERGEDGKTPEVTVTPGKDGHSTDITFTVPGKDPVTFTVKDGKNGKDGKCGCQDKPVTPSNDKPVPPTPNVPTPEVPVKPVPAVPEQPVVPTPAQPATPVNANPVAPTTGKENRGDKLPETGSQSDYISVLLGSGILLSLYVGRRKEA
ncbi:TPA: LPXTG cell wall anchor domain-containing protein, partial [Streptococcus pneumoniae]